jgi:hypothetical protein
MRNKSGIRQSLISAIVFCVLLFAVMSVDPRVKERMNNFVFGGGLSSLDNRASDVGHTLVSAVRYQSIDNGPMMIFAVGGVILFIFMFKA